MSNDCRETAHTDGPDTGPPIRRRKPGPRSSPRCRSTLRNDTSRRCSPVRMPAHIGAPVTIGNMPSTGRRQPGTCARQPVLAAFFGLLLTNRPPGGLSGARNRPSRLCHREFRLNSQLRTLRGTKCHFQGGFCTGPPDRPGYKMYFSPGFLYRRAGTSRATKVLAGIVL